MEPAFSGQLTGPDTLKLGVNEGGLLEIELSAQDPGGDPLSYSTSGLPKNARANFSGARKMISFAPDHTQSGTHSFEVVVSDGGQAVNKPVQVTVAEVNLPPVVFRIDDQSVVEGDILTFAVNYRDPDEDSVDVFTAGRVPFLTMGDNPPASIRDGNVFVFDTALLPEDEQISSAVFLFWAVDDNGGVSDSVRVEIAVVRRDSVETPELASGDEDDFLPPGFGLKTRFKNNSGQALSWMFKFLEKSGFLENAGLPELASAGDGKVKAEKGVYTYLAGDELTSQFYGIRRGWGLDLSSQEPVDGADVEVTLSYFDEDLPTEVPNFTEARLSVFGYDPGLGTWVMMEGVAVDTEANEATFTVTDYSIVDYTIGAVVDVVAPVITDLKVVAGDFTVVSTGVDTTYDLEGPYVFKMNITDDEVVSSTDAMLYYSVDGGGFEEAALTRSSGNLFTAQVAGPLSEGGSIRYYVVARDNMNEVSLPSGAPAEAYELVVVEYTAVPGDVDESGTINIFDLLNLLGVLSGDREPSLGSDVNRDGSTNIFDLLALLGILAG
ncbi:MAG: hypothetical protein JXQ83_07805 [Candidatus Glassbacteria bacterium]|nr:hypothetical protein [Candidatus Glassbacteria bacterium]